MAENSKIDRRTAEAVRFHLNRLKEASRGYCEI